MAEIKFRDIFKGYSVIIVKKLNSNDVINGLFQNNIPFKAAENKDGYIHITVSYSSFKKIKKSHLNSIIEAYKHGGTSYIVEKYKKRTGILFGGMLGMFITLISTQYLWNVEIYGNQKISDEAVVELLENYGVYEGELKRNIPLNKLHQEVLLENSNIGWLRVNFRGTTALVEVIEYTPPKLLVSGKGMTNLVSSRDARILSIEVYSGTPCVKEGDIVKAGDLLISGIVDSNLHGYSLRNAEGMVLGEVLENISVKIPLKTIEKRYTGKTYNEKSLVFWGNKIKLSKNSGNNDINYDIIVEKHRLEPFDAVKLPIYLEECIYNEYAKNDVCLTSAEAINLAYEQLDIRLAEISENGDLLSKQIKLERNEEYVILNASVYHTAEIAIPVPISKTENNINANTINEE